MRITLLVALLCGSVSCDGPERARLREVALSRYRLADGRVLTCERIFIGDKGGCDLRCEGGVYIFNAANFELVAWPPDAGAQQ